MAADKRKYPRIKPLIVNVEVKVMGQNVSFKVELLNIGAGGLCFLSKLVISKGDILFFIFPFASQSQLMKGQVVRAKGTEVGVKFLNTDEEMKRFVDLYNTEFAMQKGSAVRYKLIIPGYTFINQKDDHIQKMLELD